MQRIRITKAPRRQRVAADLGDNLGALAVRSLWQLLGLPGPGKRGRVGGLR